MSQRMPSGVCIAGMHRTGTSMVARLLNLCGLWLGPPEDLVPPAPDNPEGFWENVHLVGVNDLVLAALGGAWDAPPPLPAGWARRPDLDELALAAAELVDRLAAAGPWAWKDPRSSLTLPFWQRVVPDLRVVVCIRNPVEVARSLRARDGMPLAEGLRLWEAYYARLLADTEPGRRLVTHYAAYFDHARRELRRLLAFLGLTPPARTLCRALDAVGPRLRHQHAALQDVTAAGAGPGVTALYARLSAEAAYAEPALPRARRPSPLRDGQKTPVLASGQTG